MPRRLLALCAFAALVAGPVLLLSTFASAEVTGPCTATMNGVDVNTIDSPDTALEVPYDGTIAIDVRSSGEITGHVVRLEPIGGIAFTVDEGTDQGNGWSGSVEVADYATYGVGVYRVTGEATGPGACSGSAYVKVTGKSPLTTVAGAVGLGLTAVGAVGAGASALSIRGKIRHDTTLLFSMAQGGGDGVLDRTQEVLRNPAKTCFVHVISAFALTVAYMVSGAGAPGAAAVPPVRFRPYVSILGGLWGALFGLGTLVLAQQFAVLYPTVTILVVWVGVCALVAGVAMPSLIRLSAIRGLNARLAQLGPAGASTVPSTSTPAEPAWAPTHRVPAGGLDAWASPDPASGAPVRLDPGLQIRVEQVTGDWAQVSASNGWTGWVDGRRLERLA